MPHTWCRAALYIRNVCLIHFEWLHDTFRNYAPYFFVPSLPRWEAGLTLRVPAQRRSRHALPYAKGVQTPATFGPTKTRRAGFHSRQRPMSPALSAFGVSASEESPLPGSWGFFA